MNVVRGQTSFSEQEIADLRARLLKYKTYEGLSWAGLGKKVDIPAGTLQPWCMGTYKGDLQKYAFLVHKFFTSEDARAELELDAPLIPDFLPTETAELLFTQFTWAHRGRMTIATGTAGIGKTAAMRQYVAENSSAWLVTLSAASKTPTAMLQAILNVVGRPDANRRLSLLALFDTICDRLRDTGALLLMDEAQHARDDALDLLRAIHDEIGLGIALCGNEEVSSRIQGVTKRAAFAQLHSRISQNIRLEKPFPGDISLILNAWGVTHPKEREFLTNLASLPGCLRTLTQVLEQATLVARQEREERSLDHIKFAWGLHARQALRAA